MAQGLILAKVLSLELVNISGNKPVSRYKLPCLINLFDVRHPCLNFVGQERREFKEIVNDKLLIVGFKHPLYHIIKEKLFILLCKFQMSYNKNKRRRTACSGQESTNMLHVGGSEIVPLFIIEEAIILCRFCK